MNLNNYEKNKEFLENELLKCKKELEEKSQKVKVLSVNKLESRIEIIFVLATLPFLGLVILIFLLGPILINYVSIQSLYSIILLIPTIIGIFTERYLHNNVWNLKDRLRKISKAKTQIELLEEETKYQIDMKYLNNKIKVFEKNLDNLKNDELMMKTLSQKYDINVKDFDSTNNELETLISGLEKQLEKLYNDLYKLSKKKVLSEKFWRYRDKFQLITEPIMMSTMFGMFLMIIMAFLKYQVNISVSLLDVLLPYPIIGMIVGGFYFKRAKNSKIVFNKLNKDLKEESLNEKMNYDKEKLIEQEIIDKVKSICDVLSELQEKRRILETRNLDNSVVIDNNREKYSSTIDIDRELESEKGKVKKLIR